MKRKHALVGFFVLALFLLLAPTALASTTWYVNGVRGSDTNNCKTPQTACKTIGHAISLASSGDTISVAAATYTENVTINMSLTIHGDFATSAPTIIDGGGVNTVVTIPNAGANVTLSKLTIQNGNFSGNGGGIFNLGTLTISNGNMSRNTAVSGGAIFNYGSLTINNSTIGRNTASQAGGGIFNQGTLTISNSSLNLNTTSDYNGGGGGGVVNYYNSTLTVTDSTLNGNSVHYSGGGIENYATFTISNSTVSGNSASGPGGGIDNCCGTATINNSTLSGNSATHGGGIDNDFGGGVMLQNSIIANSLSGGNCYQGSNGGTIISNGYNLSSDNTCPFTNTGDLNNTDPKLGPLQNNGGPTWTQALLDGSPAIDAGNPNGCTDGNGNLLKTDQRGYPRPDPEDPSGCDMGAFERQGD